MVLPKIKAEPVKKDGQIIKFGGIRYGEGATFGELEESRNLSSALLPVLTQRKGRKTVAAYGSPTGLYARGKLCVVDGSSFIYDGITAGTVTPGEKQFAAINTKIVIFPDKKYYDTDKGEFGDLEAAFTGASVSFAANSITKSGAGFDALFSAGDAIDISGCTARPENNKTVIARSVTAAVITFSAGSLSAGTEASVTLKRSVPELTCICESDNRIWGASGSVIYASSLGDPKNFYVYDGLSTDSYSVAVGTDGEFTACIAYSNGVLFWKENCVHKLLGNQPSNYELYTYVLQGAKEGSEKSLVIINEVLYYHGRGGVFAFTGGAPELISENFGARRYSGAVAGSDGERYYISMKDEAGVWGLFVYDTLRGVWLREDDTRCDDFAYLSGGLYYLDHVTKKIMLAGQDDKEEGKLEWLASFAPFTEEIMGKKCYSKLLFRFEIEPEAWVQIYISRDKGPFKKVYTALKHGGHTAYIKPERCDTFRVKLTGKGSVKIKQFAREFEIGSEV